MAQHQLWDFVRPRSENDDSVWRVISIDRERLTAEKRFECLEPREKRLVIGPPDFFVSLEDEEDCEQ